MMIERDPPGKRKPYRPTPIRWKMSIREHGVILPSRRDDVIAYEHGARFAVLVESRDGLQWFYFRSLDDAASHIEDWYLPRAHVMTSYPLYLSMFELRRSVKPSRNPR